MTALTQPSQADTARRRRRHVTQNPASTAPSARTTRVTTPANAGQVCFPHHLFKNENHHLQYSTFSEKKSKSLLFGSDFTDARFRIRRPPLRDRRGRVQQQPLHARRQVHGEVVAGPLRQRASAAGALRRAACSGLRLQLSSWNNR